MKQFSERYGYSTKPLVYKSITDQIRNRVWNAYSYEISLDEEYYNDNCLYRYQEQPFPRWK